MHERDRVAVAHIEIREENHRRQSEDREPPTAVACGSAARSRRGAATQNSTTSAAISTNPVIRVSAAITARAARGRPSLGLDEPERPDRQTEIQRVGIDRGKEEREREERHQPDAALGDVRGRPWSSATRKTPISPRRKASVREKNPAEVEGLGVLEKRLQRQRERSTPPMRRTERSWRSSGPAAGTGWCRRRSPRTRRRPIAPSRRSSCSPERPASSTVRACGPETA